MRTTGIDEQFCADKALGFIACEVENGSSNSLGLAHLPQRGARSELCFEVFHFGFRETDLVQKRRFDTAGETALTRMLRLSSSQDQLRANERAPALAAVTSQAVLACLVDAFQRVSARTL
ncbi:hypothetical protein AD933_03110 [Acetobacter malorum]|uniref:Uncharacterized protein n=1 Tax=Acetobacter malorum TaxID=178901 RepID=A0A149RW45_9PROT|nr:hypothetical protein AD933_03110 [Acetobacter malorum]